LPHYHAVIWIDHREARVFHFNKTEVDQQTIAPDNPTVHIHHKANTIGSGHAPEDQAFFEAVTIAVSDAGAILIAGPANAKTELVKHIHHAHPRMMRNIAGVETVDHPSDGALLAFARTYFRADDRTRPQIT
jgi:stalled ribosome rescue protein Dom34